MRTCRYLLAGLLAGAALVTGACEEPEVPVIGLTGGWSTAGCEFPREPATVTVGRRVLPATPPELEAAMARIDSGGRADHATSYAGLEVDQENVRAVVYRVPSAAFDDFVRQAAENTCILVRDARHSLGELTTWHDHLVADLPAWGRQGVAVSTVTARHDGAGVEVGVPDPELARREMVLRYGDAAPLIFVREGPVVPLAGSGVPTVPPPGG